MLKWQEVEVLEILLLSGWSDHHIAVFFLEEPIDDPSDSILVLYLLRNSLLLSQGILQILLGGDIKPILVFQSQSEVSQDPQETRERLH